MSRDIFAITTMNKPSRLGAIFGMIAGLALLVPACGLLWAAFDGVKAGEIYNPAVGRGHVFVQTKDSDYLILREKTPAYFWVTETFYTVFGAGFAGCAIGILRGQWRDFRPPKSLE